MATRPDYKLMMADVVAGKVERIVCYRRGLRRDDHVVAGSGSEWQATVASSKGRKPELLAEKLSHTTAYLACTKHIAAKAVTA
jgi:hypothetical protein